MTSRDGNEQDHSRDGVARTGASDEEAQLLCPEELEYEEDDTARSPRLPGRHGAREAGNWGWLSGPHPPRIQAIRPLCPSFQRIPTILIRRLLPSTEQKLIVLVAFFLLWAAAFVFPLRSGTRAIRDLAGEDVVNLDCVDTLWKRKDLCGLDGEMCRPFTNASFTFRCPASCAGVQVLNPRPVGGIEVSYRPFVIGDGYFRGDSFICGSAIHAGLVTDRKGGCGRVSRIGQREGFKTVSRNGIESIAFDSYFPLAFELAAEPDLRCPADSREYLLVVSLFFTIVATLFMTSTPLQFFVSFVAIFAHVALVSDPPEASFHNISVLPDHVSKFAERLLPAAFCAVIFYWTCAARTLGELEAPFEKTLLWLGGFWFGALSNYTFGWLPIQRLTAHDLEQQPGAKLALAIIVIVVGLIVIQQVYTFWLEQRLLRYLALYGILAAGIVACWALPGVELRIHHYIIALLLLPGTSVQTRSSLLYQGLLLGLFVNGTARWGFDSILQTPASLREDGSYGLWLPSLHPPSISSTSQGSNITFSWDGPPTPVLDGVSVLVNDVERFRGFFAEAVSAYNFTWTRPAGLGLSEYFRFGYIKDDIALDYTKAGVWFPNGTWSMTARPA